jgi:hypothetical protein
MSCKTHLLLVRITGGGAINVKGYGITEGPTMGSAQLEAYTLSQGAETMSCKTHLLLVRITGGGAINVRDCFTPAIPPRGRVLPGVDTTTQGAETIV